MANTKSAKAKVREIQNKTEFNKSIKNRYRTFLKKVELNIVKGDKGAITAAITMATAVTLRKLICQPASLPK